MLIMIEKGIRGGICHVMHRYAEANNKYMKNYDNYMGKKMCLNLMKTSQKLMIKMVIKRHILEVYVEYPKDLHYLHSDLPFSPKRMKLINAISLDALAMIKNYAVCIRSLKQPLNHGLILKKVHRVIHRVHRVIGKHC